MNLQLEKKLLIALKITAVLSTIVVLSKELFEETSLFNEVFFLFSASVFGFVFIVFNSMILTNSKGLINFGAFGSLFAGLIIIGNTIFTQLSSGDLKDMYSDNWTTYLYLTQVLVACVAGLYLVFEFERRLGMLERAALVVLIPIFMIVQGMSPGKGEKLFDAFGVDMFISIASVTIIGLIVLYFSNLQHSVVFPFIVANIFLVANAKSVQDFFSPEEKPDSEYIVYAADRTFMTVVQLGFSLALVALCGFIIWRMSVTGQKAGRVPSLEQLLAEKNTKGPGSGLGPMPGAAQAPPHGSGPSTNPFANPGQGSQSGPESGPPPANPIW